MHIQLKYMYIFPAIPLKRVWQAWLIVSFSANDKCIKHLKSFMPWLLNYDGLFIIIDISEARDGKGRKTEFSHIVTREHRYRVEKI